MRHWFWLCAVVLLASAAQGAVELNKLPATVRRVERLKEAAAAAQQQKKALLFVLSEMKAKGGGKGNTLVLEATQQLFQKLRGPCVIVYVDFNTDRPKLAKALPEINAAFDTEAARGPIPRAVATDAAGEKIYAIIPYAPAGPLGEEMLKEAKQRIQDALAGKLVTDEVGIPGEKKREIAPPPPAGGGKKKTEQ
jgi:hypothetical protein